jgi:hypothetical protein
MNTDAAAPALFILVALLASGLALALWRMKRGIAIAASALAAISAVCVANEFAIRAARANIRVDLLLTIPLVSAAAVVIGVFAYQRSRMAARLTAAVLVAIGAPSFIAFAWFSVMSGRDAQRLTATFNQASKLYSQETLRCQGNLVKRFGPLTRHDNSCFGHMVVKSRSNGAYPFTRAIVNDSGEAYLLFSSADGVENNADLGDGPVAKLRIEPGGDLVTETNQDSAAMKITLRQLPAGTCEARVDRFGSLSALTLAKEELPPCDASAAPPVHVVGAWGKVAPPRNSPQTRRLTQIWLWEIDGKAYGLFLGNLATSGTYVAFQFVKQLHGTRIAEKRWELHPSDEDKYKYDRPFRLTLEDGRAHLSGPSSLLRSDDEIVLDPKEVISHPKIALIPLRDRNLFSAYFDNVLFDLNIPWTAP